MSIHEEMDFARDSRNCEAAQLPTVQINLRGRVDTLRLPHTWEVCPVCQGRGSHVNPSIDCNGITPEDFAEDPDFEEAYFEGVYDVPCNRCKGRTTVPVIDEPRLTHRQRRALLVHRARQAIENEYERQAHAEHMAELRAGC